MANIKKYILTGVVLGSIAAVAAGLIAATNLVTKDRIQQNEIDKLNKGLVKIFDNEKASILEDEIISETYVDSDSKFNVSMSHFYKVEDRDNKDFLGYAVRCDGSNDYGKISLIAGFEPVELSFKTISVITNEQSYASTLKKKYINSVENGGDYESENAVHCGATYGATLIRAMIRGATKLVNEKGAKNV